MTWYDRFLGRPLVGPTEEQSRQEETIRIQEFLNRNRSESYRSQALEALWACRTPEFIAALVQIIMDETETDGLREEAASVLGDIYKFIGINEEIVVQMPEEYREHLLCAFNGK